MNAPVSIPIFPLNVVLFPSSRLPLHIFEDRYKKLIERCLNEQGEFGINLIEGNRLREVGCTARILEVVQRFDDGRSDIIIEGIARYRMKAMQQHADGYLVASVEWIDEDDELPDQLLMQRAADLISSVVDVLFPDARLAFSSHERLSAFRIAEKSGMELSERQEILEMDSERERLTRLVAHLENLLPKIQDFEYMRRLIHNDGYITPKRD